LKKLVIISHTEHQINSNGQIVGWGPTVNEISFLAEYWDEVVHVACLEKKVPKGSSLPYSSSKVRLMPIAPFGGKRLWQKLDIISKAPQIIRTIRTSLVNATHVQLRLPMGIGLYVLPYFFIRRKNAYTLWVKYANNWGQRNPSLGYGLQRWMLKKNFADCKVTINGFWPNQPKHCISFENPSLYEKNVLEGILVASKKSFYPPYRLIFIGRVERAKGILELLHSLKLLPPEKILNIDIVGEGSLLPQVEQFLKDNGIPHTLHGFLPNEEVFTLLKLCHFLCLPSESEGFPKVVSEAACFGCIPVVSDVGSIDQYITQKVNGFVWAKNSSIPFSKVLFEAISNDPEMLKKISNQLSQLAKMFTFERFYKKLCEEIFG